MNELAHLHENWHIRVNDWVFLDLVENPCSPCGEDLIHVRLPVPLLLAAHEVEPALDAVAECRGERVEVEPALVTVPCIENHV
jgi:hypothetical protein